MAKICPQTNDYVLYLECNECEQKRLCKPLSVANRKLENKSEISNNKGEKANEENEKTV